jgi:hypothetical protein
MITKLVRTVDRHPTKRTPCEMKVAVLEAPALRKAGTVQEADRYLMRSSLLKEFRPACRYIVTRGKVEGFKTLDRELWRETGVVYARMWQGKMVYIGCTDGRLSARINDHLRRIQSKSTRGRTRTNHYRAWVEGKEITIFAYKPEPVHLFGYEIPIHRSLEAKLISEFGRKGEADWFVRRC